jgi:hypothetical protein
MTQSNTVTTATGVKIETTKSPVKFREFSTNGKAEFQKEGTKTVILEQEIITKTSYPAKKVGSSLDGNLFGADDFGFESKDFENKELRLAFMNVPVNATQEQVQAKLDVANAAGAVIYKLMSNQPILDENQLYAITAGLRTKDQFANSQVARFPKDAKDDKGNDIGGQIILHNDKPFYRRTAFATGPVEDVDNRAGSDYYVSPEIEAELKSASVLAGQTF